MTIGDHAPSDSTPPSAAGLVLAPFRALRYADDARSLGERLCPPYDVIDADQQASLERRDAFNAVRLILPRDDTPDPASRYGRAARTLREWRSTGVLRQDSTPAVYVYEMSSSETRTRGLLGALALVDPGAGIVLPHENTMPGPVADRLALTEATQANLEPIYLVYDGGPVAAEAVATADVGPTLAEAHTSNGLRHRLWAITSPALLQALATELRPRHALIADGHHRYATYLEWQARAHGSGAGPGPWDLGLAYLVDARQFGPHVEAIHRVIPSLALPDAIAALGSCFTVTTIDGGISTALAALRAAGESGRAFVLTDGATWSLLRQVADDRSQGPNTGPTRPLDQLDVTVAHRVLVKQLWNLDEDLLEYEHDVERAVRRARATNGLALLLNPTPVRQVAAVAADGDRMPRKSTLFTPKPATGMVFRLYGGDG